MFIRTASDLGAAIREHRLKLGLGQSELARNAGVSRQWLSGVENGRPGAELGLVLRVINILGMRIDARHIDKTAHSSREIDAIVDNARKSGR